MKVALVHDWLTGMRGGEFVLEEIAALFPTAPIYTLFHFPGTVSKTLESHPIVTSGLQHAPGIESRYRHYLPFFPTAIEEFDLTDYDLVVSVSHAVAKSVISGQKTFHLCYCNTPMRWAWDMEHVYFPKRTGPVARLRAMILSHLRQWDVRTAERVSHFVGNSSFVAERIERYYQRPADVLHPPVDTDYYTPTEKPKGDYCLMVAALAPYKRADLAIAACARLGIELRVVGTGPEQARLEQLSDGTTKLLGRVSREELRELYRGARCVIQPGVEDFGISSVEALACGTPMVAAGRGGILDIVNDGIHGTLYPQEESVEALAQAIDKTLNLRFNSLDLRKRAEAFSTRRFVEGLRGLVDERIEN